MFGKKNKKEVEEELMKNISIESDDNSINEENNEIEDLSIEDNNEINLEENIEQNYEDVNLDESISEEESVTIDDDEQELKKNLLIEYLGNNKEDFFKYKFSAPGFLFGPIYLMYRKIYFIGLLLSMIIVFLCLKVDIVYGLALFGVSNVVISLLFNKLYLDYSYDNMMKIMKNYSNRSKEELIIICREKGRTSFSRLIICILLLVLTGFLIIK